LPDIPASPILVTGATGFIGARLTAALRAAGAEVRTFGRRPEAVDVAGDLRDPSSLVRAVRDCRTVFHLASVVHQRNEAAAAEHLGVGREGTARLLDAARSAGVESVVFVSSLAVYGSTFPAPVSESDPCQPDTEYGRQKLAAEKLVLDWGAAGRRAVCLRPPMTYGAGCKGNLPRLVRAIAGGWCPPIPNTPARRSLLHVDSLVEALLRVAVHPRAAGRVFNVADEEALSTGEIYDLLMRAVGRTPPRWRVPLTAFRAAARAGDLAAGLTGRAAFDTRAYWTLFGPAEACTKRICDEVGYRSTRRFSTSVTEVVEGCAVVRRGRAA
jgi:nucleoside-diphosphate-sugar epimerase